MRLLAFAIALACVGDSVHGGGGRLPDRDHTMTTGSLFDARRRAERVIAGTQTGQYKKLELARDLVTFTSRLETAERLLARWEGGQLHPDVLYRETKEFLGG